jgi:hypothetical protein
VPIWSSSWDKWDWILLVFITGAGFLFLRFLIRCYSLWQLRRKAKLVPAEGIKLYHVNESIIPFSFGNSIFINCELHNETELQEIIRHEFVHIKQKHTIDILWAELLCMLNWYNPFAWLLKATIRQNLEFIADNKVLANGIDKKQYQYLLLKVTGNNHFSIAHQFNFSSLKKRIAMMNKMKTARIHLLRFFFILPLLAVVLLSFRKQIGDTLSPPNKETGQINLLRDTIPGLVQPNDKGYYFDIQGKNDKDAIITVRNKEGKEVERVSLAKWKANQERYESLYGELIPPPPPPSVPPIPPMPPAGDDPGIKAFLERNPDVKSISWVTTVENEKMIIEAHITKKDGSREIYNLDDAKEKATVEKLYGELPIPPPPPSPPVPPPPPAKTSDEISVVAASPSTIGSDFEITDKKATVYLKDGKKEVYDITDKSQRKKFEDKYGKIINVNTNVNVNTVGRTIVTPVKVVTMTAPVSAVSVHTTGTTISAPVITSTIDGTTIISPVTTAVSVHSPVIHVDDNGMVTTIGEEQLVITITKKTTPDQLEDFKKQMKEKGIELKYDETHYEKGVLTHVSGTIKFKDGSGSFSGTDFNILILAVYKNGDDIYFKVRTTDNKEVI